LLITLLGYGELKYNLERDEKGMNGRLRFTTSFDVSVGVTRIADNSTIDGTDQDVEDEVLKNVVQDFDKDNMSEESSPVEQAPTDKISRSNDTLLIPPKSRVKNRLTILLHSGILHYDSRLRSQLDTWLHPTRIPKGVNLVVYTVDDVVPGIKEMVRVGNMGKDGVDEGRIAMNERVLQSFEHAFLVCLMGN
jgi:hypothetical protein